MTAHPFETLKLRAQLKTKLSNRRVAYIAIWSNEDTRIGGHVDVPGEHADALVALFNAQAKLLTGCKQMVIALQEIGQAKGLTCFHGDALDEGLAAIRAAEPEPARSET